MDSFMQRTTSIAAGNLAATCSVLGLGAIFLYHRATRNRNRKVLSPVGELVNLTHSTQHVWVRGPKHGIPVVFIHGFGCCSMEFESVVEALLNTGKYQVVLHDRVLYQSKPFSRERTAEVLVSELYDILEQLQVTSKQIILVGHSYGGLIAQYFAARYPGSVSGMVLIDPAHEDQFEPPSPRGFGMCFKLTPYIFRLYQLISPLGFIKALDLLSLMNFPPLFLYPKTERQVAVELYSNSVAWKLVRKELEGCFKSYSDMRKLREHIPEIPTRVLIAGKRQYTPSLYPDLITKAFTKLHIHYAQQKNGSLIVVDDSDHWIHVQNPRIVIDSVDHIASLLS